MISDFESRLLADMTMTPDDVVMLNGAWAAQHRESILHVASQLGAPAIEAKVREIISPDSGYEQPFFYVMGFLEEYEPGSRTRVFRHSLELNPVDLNDPVPRTQKLVSTAKSAGSAVVRLLLH